jgi:hypothetical protein
MVGLPSHETEKLNRNFVSSALSHADLRKHDPHYSFLGCGAEVIAKVRGDEALQFHVQATDPSHVKP